MERGRGEKMGMQCGSLTLVKAFVMAPIANNGTLAPSGL